MRSLLVLTCAIALSGCATADLTPVNAPLTAPPTHPQRDTDAGEDVIVLALSGGGARAASFSLGALQGLRALHAADGRPLTAHVAMITSVSGGSILSAYYGLHGDGGLDEFRAEYLDKDWPLHSPTTPTNWLGTLNGGANGPRQLADWLDRELYAGARMDALIQGPRIILNASDLYNGTPFAFTQLYFDGLCSDLAGVRVADAVAASMAVPVYFRPVLLQAYPDRCTPSPDWADRTLGERGAPEMVRATARAFRNYRDATQQRYLHLVDGGVVDNLGVTTLSVMRAAGPAPAPFTPLEAVRARRILFLVVNAERVRPLSWQLEAAGPGGGDVIASTLDVATDVAKRSALDAFRASLPDLERDLVQYRCGLDPRDVREPRNEAWRCDDLDVTMEVISLADLDPSDYDALIATPTLVTLPAETVDALISGGRAAVERNAAVRALTH